MKQQIDTYIHRKTAFQSFLLCGLVLAPLSLSAQILFSDVSGQAGFQGFSQSYGASWGDFNGDGWPDLFDNNHLLMNSIHRNNQNGTFTDVASQVDGDGFWSGWRAKEDTHGASWGDFDNDGDQDLMISTGRCCNVQYFVNDNGMLYNRTEESGFFGDIDGGGRMPIWFDMDDDGSLEVAFMTFFAANLYGQTTPGAFADVRPGTGFSCTDDMYGVLVDINGDGRLEVLCVTRGGPFAPQVFDTTTTPFTNVTSWLPEITNVNDIVLGDFDGNLRTDMLLLRGALRPNDIALFNGNRIEALLASSGGGKAFSFKSSGVLSVKLDWNKTWEKFGNIFIGASGYHPAAEEFVLDPANPAVAGIKACDPVASPHPQICIGYDQSTQTWEFRWETDGEWVSSYFQIDGAAGISNIVEQGVVSAYNLPQQPTLLLNQDWGMQATSSREDDLGEKIPCVSGVAGDFDNDMDEDIYLVCRDGVENLENRLYENDGSGNFTWVPGAGGAMGVTGAAIGAHAGTSDSVVVADYDVDGLLDLFVTNGLNLRPNTSEAGGPDQLFRNIGNARQWIEIDLVGITSNRDGIGARVEATAGGKTQLRSQNGGYHRWSQNHQRLHFGLADNQFVDLKVYWPSGAMNEFKDVPAGHLYRITENSGIEEVTLQSGGLPPTQPSDECGAPAYNPGTEKNVFLWKDCNGSELWYMRATAGGSPSVITYSGDVTSSQAFNSVTPFSLESNDVLDNSTDPLNIAYTLKMLNAGEDGFDFRFPAGANPCFDTTGLPAGAGVLLGANRIPVTTPIALETLQSCQSTPPPPSGGNECGAPAFDSSIDDGLFVWKDCDQDVWHLRAVAGDGYKHFLGNLAADQDFADVTPISLESTDNLTNSPLSRIDFDLRVAPPWFDGIDFTIPCSAMVSFDLIGPVGVDVHLGPSRTVVPVPFNLTDYGSCAGGG